MKITQTMIEVAAEALADMQNVPHNVKVGEGYFRTDLGFVTRDWHRVAAEAALIAAMKAT